MESELPSAALLRPGGSTHTAFAGAKFTAMSKAVASAEALLHVTVPPPHPHPPSKPCGIIQVASAL